MFLEVKRDCVGSPQDCGPRNLSSVSTCNPSTDATVLKSPPVTAAPLLFQVRSRCDFLTLLSPVFRAVVCPVTSISDGSKKGN